MEYINKLSRLKENEANYKIYASCLQKAGLSITPSRLNVISTFYIDDYSRLSAVDVYKHLSKSKMPLSLSTIYNVLNDFVKTGILLVNSFENSGKIFELNRGKNTGVINCPVCNKSSYLPDLELGSLYSDKIKELGFVEQRYSFSIMCLCIDCGSTQ